MKNFNFFFCLLQASIFKDFFILLHNATAFGKDHMLAGDLLPSLYI